MWKKRKVDFGMVFSFSIKFCKYFMNHVYVVVAVNGCSFVVQNV